MDLWLLACLVVLFNLPFGYWRANVNRLSLSWFLAIHLPVPFIVAARVLGGIGWELATFPVLIAAYSLGQFVGGQILSHWRKASAGSISSCLVMDTMRRAAALLATLAVPR